MSHAHLTWIIGAGPMAVAYHAVMKALSENVIIVGRSDQSARDFQAATGATAYAGGLTAFLSSQPDAARTAIVAVGVEQLAPVTRQLLQAGVKRILIEKPAALLEAELVEVIDLAQNCEADLFVAYNRRFYASTAEARRLIAEDGGVQSCHFEFTEWSHIIEGLEKADGVKSNWLIGNSSHVIDLAFHLAGMPVDIRCFTAGSLNWHPSSAVFAGAGRTDTGALFSYQANWNAPGRWGIELTTANRRLVFRPMEKLQIMQRGELNAQFCALDDELDLQFKAGIYEQVRSFLDGEDSLLCTAVDQARRWNIYRAMGGYDG